MLGCAKKCGSRLLFAARSCLSAFVSVCARLRTRVRARALAFVCVRAHTRTWLEGGGRTRFATARAYSGMLRMLRTAHSVSAHARTQRGNDARRKVKASKGTFKCNSSAASRRAVGLGCWLHACCHVRFHHILTIKLRHAGACTGETGGGSLQSDDRCCSSTPALAPRIETACCCVLSTYTTYTCVVGRARMRGRACVRM